MYDEVHVTVVDDGFTRTLVVSAGVFNLCFLLVMNIYDDKIYVHKDMMFEI